MLVKELVVLQGYLLRFPKEDTLASTATIWPAYLEALFVISDGSPV